eukprot:s4735_g6.t1
MSNEFLADSEGRRTSNTATLEFVVRWTATLQKSLRSGLPGVFMHTFTEYPGQLTLRRPTALISHLFFSQVISLTEGRDRPSEQEIPFRGKSKWEERSDPFLIFSWHLRQSSPGAANTSDAWRSAPQGLEAVAFDAKCSETPVLFRTSAARILDHIYQQLLRIGAIFHALEARDASWALDLRATLISEDRDKGHGGSGVTKDLADKPSESRRNAKPPPSTARRRGRVTYKTAADKVAPVSSYQHAHISDELRRRVAEEEEEERTIELTRTDIELRRRRRDLSLELELRDYVTLASMKAKEADWWGEGARNASAYAMRQVGGIATWSPALEEFGECAPLKLRIFGYAGSPWNVLKAACFHGATFDAIDAGSALCQGIGYLGLSTWFDTLLKMVPHSYIQTRHCEESFSSIA